MLTGGDFARVWFGRNCPESRLAEFSAHHASGLVLLYYFIFIFKYFFNKTLRVNHLSFIFYAGDLQVRMQAWHRRLFFRLPATLTGLDRQTPLRLFNSPAMNSHRSECCQGWR
jgi:hypothetical protein